MLGQTILIKQIAGLSPIQRYLSDTFIVISAFKAEYSLEENLARNRALITDIRKANLGGLQLVGHWIPCAMKAAERTSEARKAIEYSFLVPISKDYDPMDFIDLAILLGRKYGLEAILTGDKFGFFALDFDDNESCIYRIGAVGALTLENIGDYYSMVKRKAYKIASQSECKFVFEGFSWPRNFAEALAFESLGRLPNYV